MIRNKGDEQNEEEEKEEKAKHKAKVKLNVDQYVGQSLIKNDTTNAMMLKQQAKMLTGIPLIKGQQHHDEQLYLALYHQHQMSLKAFYQMHQRYQDVSPQPTSTGPPRSNPEEDFQSRVIKPRRKRRAHSKVNAPIKDMTAEANKDAVEEKWEVDFEDEMHFLPTDLLTDECKGKQDNENKHSQLRKTCSWTSPGRPSEETVSHQHPKVTFSFSLFPQTSQSDLLCSVRNDLLASDPSEKYSTKTFPSTTSSNLEQAIKNLSIESAETSNSRKF